ncbi:hypothetical protein scyTo_0008520 [Scyliorhinus torazame]|uniref:Uncharacterized protein n=1 Tax=Scyliorhinus torazame TaxID=75743 RepID=A0A401PAQ9_SCYTO|nr:hypothetical protein [Scyliorhinus torazame]
MAETFETPSLDLGSPSPDAWHRLHSPLLIGAACSYSYQEICYPGVSLRHPHNALPDQTLIRPEGRKKVRKRQTRTTFVKMGIPVIRPVAYQAILTGSIH